ncbi:MAG TPA: alkaline phosphatase PhoX [Acidocella sp.]|jgi:secreted PhoX family phosphatase|uniref:PhoX family protein n=1 Tax=Acidocella sp. TaxID=50710 RepID=UPI002CB343AC|nr:alkaline phosphatase PhoX [Acidocella sp.]HVE23398.1 alkaline phosphatase PhoX [Acidocella sp.]
MAASNGAISRRTLLGGLSALALASTARAQSVLATNPAPSPQAPKRDDTVAGDFQRLVVARWGDGVLPNAPPFAPDQLTALQAGTQFPYDAVITALVNPPPAQDGIPRLVMVLANPDAPARMVFPGGADEPAVAGQLQGATVLNLQYLAGRWMTVDGGYQARRITDGTLCQITGPVAAAIGSTVQGVLAPQAGCATPWGTALLAEGNVTPWLTRLASTDDGYADPADGARFGWVTEFDPLDPGSFPTKHTGLGRFARAGIAVTTTPDGRAVLFMSQDEPAGFLFRFISAAPATDGSAFEAGTLSVAQINGGGIDWVDLGTDIPTLAATVSAAASAGGSPFDAPGGIAIVPGNGGLYLACRGNPARTTADALNPRTGDDNGHIVLLAPPHGDMTARRFAGRLALVAGNPATAPLAQYSAGSTAWLKNPRTLNLDPYGQLWIGTDQRGHVSDTADGLFTLQTNGPSRFLLSAAYLAPIGAAIGGAAFDTNTRTIFSVARHPGATPQASFDHPATRWPTLQPSMPPQTTVIGLVQQ